MAEQELNGSEIAGPPGDQVGLRSSKGVGAKESRLQSDPLEPVVQQARILAGGHWLAAATGKQPKPGLPLGCRQLILHSVLGLLCHTEPYRSAGPPLFNGASLARAPVWSFVLAYRPSAVITPQRLGEGKGGT